MHGRYAILKTTHLFLQPCLNIQEKKGGGGGMEWVGVVVVVVLTLNKHTSS